MKQDTLATMSGLSREFPGAAAARSLFETVLERYPKFLNSQRNKNNSGV